MPTYYENNKAHRLLEANKRYYKTKYNLDYESHHEKYKQYNTIINKVAKENFPLDILCIVLRHQNKERLLNNLAKSLEPEDIEEILTKMNDENSTDLGKN